MQYSQGTITWTKQQYLECYERNLYRPSPFLFFHHAEGDHDSHPAFFLSIPVREEDNLRCEIGICHRIHPVEYSIYAFNLAKERRAEVGLGNGQAVIVNLRQSNHAKFLSASIGIPRSDNWRSYVVKDCGKD